VSGWTNTDAARLMDGKIRLYAKGPDFGGPIPGEEFETVLEAQGQAARLAAAFPGCEILMERAGRWIRVPE
jgi:hypothetical protein